MAAKRKNPSEQPELPILSPAPPNPPPSPVPPKQDKNGHDELHVQAEQVEVVVPRPFVPGKIELPLHRRVDRSFLDYFYSELSHEPVAAPDARSAANQTL